jgi:hypothetical protein
MGTTYTRPKRNYAKWEFMIDFGDGFEYVYPVRNFDIKKKRDGLNYVLDIEPITFFEDKYGTYTKIITAALTVNSLPIRIYKDGNLFAEKELDIFSVAKDLKNKRIKCPVSNQENDLLQKILLNKDVEFNLLEAANAGELDLTFDTKAIFLITDIVPEPAVPDENWAATIGCDYADVPAWSSTKAYRSFGQFKTNWGTPDAFVLYGGLVYRSLQSGNLNNQPDISPAYWVQVVENLRAALKLISVNPIPGAQFYDYQIDADLLDESGEDYTFLSGTYPNEPFFEASTYFLAQNSVPTFNYTLKQGRKLSEIVEKIFNKIDLNINFTLSGGPDCWCNYLENSLIYNDIRLFDNSDVRFPNASSPATFSKLTLSRFLDIMRTAFGLEWKLNGSNYIQFIHKSENGYFDTVTLNLQKLYSYDYTADNMKFDVKQNKDVRCETFTYNNSGQSAFDQVLINYKAKGEQVDYSLREMTGNVAELLKGSDSQLNNDGIAWVACDGTDVLEFDLIANGYMTAEKLFREHQTYERPYPVGTIGIEQITLNTADNNEAGRVRVIGADIETIDMTGLVITKLSEAVGVDGFRIKEFAENIESGIQSLILEF